MSNDWQIIGPDLWKAYFNDAVTGAAMAGFTVPGLSSLSGKMGRAIAYSVIDEGTRVFGDTAVRAMFNDANDLGKAVPFGSSPIAAGKGAIAEILMQFAGQLAFGKVLMPNTAALNGVLALSPDNSVLTVDFNDALWSIGRQGPQPTILGRDTLINISLGKIGPTGVSDLRTGLEWLYNNAGTSVIDRIAFATTDTSTT
jgi:hypothetical protein